MGVSFHAHTGLWGRRRFATHLVEQPAFQNALDVGNDDASHSPPADGGAKAL